MLRLRHLAARIAVVFGTFTATLPTGADDRFDGLDAYVAAAKDRWQVPGLALAVVKDGNVVLARGYGVCELGTNRNVTPGTAFGIASRRCASNVSNSRHEQ